MAGADHNQQLKVTLHKRDLQIETEVLGLCIKNNKRDVLFVNLIHVIDDNDG